MTHPYHAVKGRIVPSFFPKISREETTVFQMAVVWTDEGFDSLDPTGVELEPQLLALAIECAGVDAQDAGGVFAARAALEQ
jgi:hypothetical protein